MGNDGGQGHLRVGVAGNEGGGEEFNHIKSGIGI